MMGNISEHFSRKELECRCGCGIGIIPDPELITKLEKARVHAGIPFAINSGVRCPKHNKAEGGVANSSHLRGLAADIKIRGNKQRFLVVKGLLHAGFKRIKVKRTFVHCDVDEGKVQEWLGV